MTEKNYKFITGILSVTNTICLITIGVFLYTTGVFLYGEIFTLQEKLSEVTDIVRDLNDETSKIQAIQEETLLNENRITTGNDRILIATGSILCIVLLMHFGGSDVPPGGIRG